MLNTNSSPEDQALLKVFLLSALRAATCRCDLDRNELVTIGHALHNDWITAEGAVAWLADIGLVDQVVADEVRS
jgi:hypothetical protein